MTLNELGVGELMGSARFLRRVAITTALIENNHVMLERLLPPEHEVKGTVAPRGIARALEQERQREASASEESIE